MVVWCPGCDNSTNYWITEHGMKKQPEGRDEDLAIFYDNLQCRYCGKSFKMEWYSYIRNSFLLERAQYIRGDK